MDHHYITLVNITCQYISIVLGTRATKVSSHETYHYYRIIIVEYEQ